MSDVVNEEIEQIEAEVEQVEADIAETEDNVEDANETEDQSTDEVVQEENSVKKLKNANQRKDRKINKLYAQKKQLEERLAALEAPQEKKSINPDDYEEYGEYMKAEMEALVDNKQTQSQRESEKAYLEQQKQQILAERASGMREQIMEVAKVIPDLPDVWQQNAQTLNALPDEVTEMFYGLDNAPVAVYSLAKEGKLESLMYLHPQIAANEIWAAQQRGIAMMSKPRAQTTQAPQPMKSVKGTGTTQKNLMEGSVLANLGLKS